MRYDDALRMADNVMTYRTIVKEIAHAHGCYATFMPKPLSDENGSGMHTHQSLFRGDQNAFFDPDGEYLLSADGQGVRRRPAAARARDLVRLRPVGQLLQAPGAGLRGAGVRGVEPPQPIGDGPRADATARAQERTTRAELRCPDPACNPYLTFAALLHAGLEGIEKGYELPPPMETNLYDLTHEERERAGIDSLPETLGEAIELGAASELLLKCLGEHIHSRYVELKREEWEDYRVQVTPFEVERYLPLL